MKLALAILLVLAACEAKKAEPNGIGQWRFGHTTSIVRRFRAPRGAVRMMWRIANDVPGYTEFWSRCCSPS